MNQRKGITVYLTEKEKNDFKAICVAKDSDMAKTLSAYAKQVIRNNKGLLNEN